MIDEKKKSDAEGSEDAVLDKKPEEKKEVTASEKPAEGSSSEAKKEEPIEIRNVVVIDDSKALRRVLVKYLLTKFNCAIVECDNGKEGLLAVSEKNGDIQLILCDLMMPVMDGLTFLRNLKAMPGMQKIPVIFLTAKNDKDTVTKCAKAGANDFIIKPYELSTMAKKLDKYLKTKSS